MHRSTRALRTVPALFLILAITTAWAEPAASREAAHTAPAAAPAAARAVTAAAGVLPAGAVARFVLATAFAGGILASTPRVDEPLPERIFTRPTVAQAAPTEVPKAKAKPISVAKPQPKAAPAPTIVRNHFWIPKLGMSHHVYLFECTRSRPPDNYIYRWGCAGTNNVYLLGHAYGVMKPLHDLYVRGGLRVGLVAKYADRKGVVHTYRVTSWRVVDPVESAWAIADQPRPSMTLQTCVGKDSRYRLNVRLVEV